MTNNSDLRSNKLTDKQENGINVLCTTIDDFTRINDLQIDFIKADIEGQNDIC